MDQMWLRVWDVEHGACAMICSQTNGQWGRLAMIDSGSANDWRPSVYIRNELNRSTLDYLFITNADQDHMSDLQGLWDANISVSSWFHNPSPSADQYRHIKRKSGPLTADAERYVSLCQTYTGPLTEPFNNYMGGITATTFWNTYPRFEDTNNLSLVVFIEYAGFRILFPGDLEGPGWLALLESAAFRQMLSGTHVLVASHHGRRNGFCEDVFNYCTPSAVVVSDKPIEHGTQDTVPDYRNVTRDAGVIVETTGKTRHVLTTRRDGWIQFNVRVDGTIRIQTEYKG